MNRSSGVRMLSLRLLALAWWDFLKGMCLLHSGGPCIVILGSARLGEGQPVYTLARTLGRSLGDAGFTVMTGGGPGVMEAANRGARESGARSLGCRMAFPFEQQVTRYFDRSVTVRYFFVRKVVMCRQAAGFVVLPGGIGTLDELFEVLALMQTRRMRRKPIVLLGRTYWQPLLDLLSGMVAAGTIAPADLALLTVTDDVTQAIACVTESTAATCGRSLERSPAA
jgi:uncharacterized protein (TIGR00730 family)